MVHLTAGDKTLDEKGSTLLNSKQESLSAGRGWDAIVIWAGQMETRPMVPRKIPSVEPFRKPEKEVRHEKT